MKIEIADYCIRCGICEDLYPDLFKRNYKDHCIDILMDEIRIQWLIVSVRLLMTVR